MADRVEKRIASSGKEGLMGTFCFLVLGKSIEIAFIEHLLCADAGYPAVGKVLTPGPLGALGSHVGLGVFRDVVRSVTGLQAGTALQTGR